MKKEIEWTIKATEESWAGLRKSAVNQMSAKNRNIKIKYGIVY